MRKTNLFIASFGLCLAIIFGFLSIPSKPQHTELPYFPTVISHYTEIMPEGPGEFSRTHILDKSGQEKEILIAFDDGSKGVLKLYANGKVQQEVLYFTDGSTRKEVFYDERGALLSGYQYRQDRSLIWRSAATSDNSETSLKIYWSNNQLFLDQKIDHKNGVKKSTYFHENGNIWQETELRGNTLISLNIYNGNGKLSLKLTSSKSDRGQNQFHVSYFRADGKIDFKQTWEDEAYYYYYYYNQSNDTNPEKPILYRLRSVEIYAKDSDWIQIRYRTAGSDPPRVDQIDKLNKDGSGLSYGLQWDSTIYEIRTLGPNGKILSQRTDWNGRLGKEIADTKYLIPIPNIKTPETAFKERESQLKRDLSKP